MTLALGSFHLAASNARAEGPGEVTGEIVDKEKVRIAQGLGLGVWT